MGTRYQSIIQTCLTGEVESSSSPIRRQAPDVKYPEKVECQPDPDMRYPDEVKCQPDSDMRYPDEVERRSDRMAAVRHQGGMSAEKNSGCDTSGWSER